MHGAGSGYLIALTVAATVVTYSSADAETSKRVTHDARGYLAAASPAPTYRRAAFIPPTGASERGNWSPDGYAQMIADASVQHDVPEGLIWAVIRVESGFDPNAVSRRGAGGLMQLMPETAAVLGVRNVFDPWENIQAGTRHLRAMMERFPRDVRLAVAAYNAGEKAVAAFRGVPPYRETRNYVTRVMRFYGGARETGRVPARVAAAPARPVPSRPAPARPSVDESLLYGSNVQRFIAVDGTVTYTNIPGTRVASAR